MGTLTDRDIAIRLVADGKPLDTKVRDLMTGDIVLVCSPEDDIEQAESQMADCQVCRLLCTDDNGQLLGVVSLSDIVSFDDSPAAYQTMAKVKDVTGRPH